MNQIRHGDVLLLAVENEIPQWIKPKSKVILAEGELTGHAHILTASKVYEWEENGQRYVRVTGELGTLYHEEHDPIPVKVLDADTTYRVIQQQEWDLKNQWRKVQD